MEPRQMRLKQINSTSPNTEAPFLVRSISKANNVWQRETSWRSSCNTRLCLYIWNKTWSSRPPINFSQSRLWAYFSKILLLSILLRSLPFLLIIYKSKRVNFLGLVTSIRKRKHTNYKGLFTIKYYDKGYPKDKRLQHHF